MSETYTQDEWAKVCAGMVFGRYPGDWRRIDGVLTYCPPQTSRPYDARNAEFMASLWRGGAGRVDDAPKSAQ